MDAASHTSSHADEGRMYLLSIVSCKISNERKLSLWRHRPAEKPPNE